MKSVAAAMFGLAMAMAAGLAGCDTASSEPGAPVASYGAVVRGEVDVAGGLVRVFSQRSGRLARMNGKLGQHVQAGDLLGALDARALQAEVLVAKAEADTAHARQLSARVDREAGSRLLARLQAAQAADAASPRAVDEARTALEHQASLERVADAEAATALLKVKATEQSLAELEIRAPVDGELVQVHAAPFMRVSADDAAPLFVLLPDGPRIVRAAVNEEFADQIHNGSAAEVVVEGPVEKVFPALAVRVSTALRHSASASDGTEPIDARVLDCEVDVDAPHLRVGQQVLVRFLRGGA